MTWVRTTRQVDGNHACDLPMREAFLPQAQADAAGSFGDLWRCDVCGTLWRVGNSCEACDPAPPGGRCIRGGCHPSGTAWRPATWWQRFGHRKSVDLGESPAADQGRPR